MANKNSIQTAVFGSGCFWCAEAIFNQLKGIQSVTSGYAGGHIANPTYQQVCSDTTGNAEVVRIEFDASVITYQDLLEIFWQTHDPTTPNRQGNDVGSQYRSIVLYLNEEQKQRWLPGCVSGEMISALAMTEPNAGSDVQAMKTTAIKDGDSYVINGQKTFISNGLLADVVVVAAKTDPKIGRAHV